MTIQEIFESLKNKFPDAESILEEIHPDPIIRIKATALVDTCKELKENADLAFNCLMCLSGVETKEELQVVYHLYSMKYGIKVTLRVGGSLEVEFIVPTVSEIWPTADWHEREAYDLYGIKFDNHQDLRRILLPDDWEGHPLRKDYVAQKVWHGITLENPPSPSAAEANKL